MCFQKVSQYFGNTENGLDILSIAVQYCNINSSACWLLKASCMIVGSAVCCILVGRIVVRNTFVSFFLHHSVWLCQVASSTMTTTDTALALNGPQISLIKLQGWQIGSFFSGTYYKVVQK